MAEGFCTKCSFEIGSFKDLNCCPKCGTKDIPCTMADQINISINLQELRILCMWAEFHVSAMKSEQSQAHCSEILRAIVQRIKKQVPPDKKVDLLFSEELQGIKDEGFEVETDFTSI
jgi:predicted Mrr-cat superfamily restriction endonuclease